MLRTVIAIGLILLLGSSCESQEKRYSQDSPEIDIAKSLIKNYNDKTYDISIYADTSETRYNSTNGSLSPSEVIAYHQENDANFASRGFLDNEPEYEMIVNDDGEVWVNCWLDWKGELAANKEVITIPIHLTYQFKEGKIVREIGLWDRAPLLMALQKIATNNSMNADEKAIQATITNIAKAWNSNDVELINSNVAINLTRSDNGNVIARNPSEYGSFMELYHNAFPDFKVAIDNTVIQGNKAHLHWTCTGTNTGQFMENKPTGKEIKTHGYSIWTFNTAGKAIQEEAFYDNLVVYQQLGYTMPTLNN
ncbi:MAG: ester cyclase [Arenibacter sp.]|nr:ester cyclase [Arenibacter sp.]